MRAAAGTADDSLSGWIVRRTLLAFLIGCLLAACARTAPVIPGPAPAVLTVLTWNMHGGRGDLSRLIDDLEAGVLTGARTSDYVLLLQEFVDRGGDAVIRSRTRELTLFISPVRGPMGNAIVSTVRLEEPRTIDLPREGSRGLLPSRRYALAARSCSSSQRIWKIGWAG